MKGAITRVLIRPATTLGDFDTIIKLQLEIWGLKEPYVGMMPLRTAAHTGGQVLLAFLPDGDPDSGREGEPVGFSIAFIGRPEPDRKLAVFSELVGVVKRLQDNGVGRQIKLAQKRLLNSNGIDLMRWTFWPMMAFNAHFNASLGARAHEFGPNFYGVLEGELYA